jgi:hypothetical protein
MNSFNSHIQYQNGELKNAGTRTDKSVTITPKRAFAFSLSLFAALRKNAETPEQVKKNLKAIEHITSLDGYINRLCADRKQSPEVVFNERHLKIVYPKLVDAYTNPKYF